MCEKAVDPVSGGNPWALKYVPDKFKTLEMCEKAVTSNILCTKYVPDKFKPLKCVKKAVINILMH